MRPVADGVDVQPQFLQFSGAQTWNVGKKFGFQVDSLQVSITSDGHCNAFKGRLMALPWFKVQKILLMENHNMAPLEVVCVNFHFL